MREMRERPFEYLRRRENGSRFENQVVKNWYIARAFILDKLSNIAFKPNSNVVPTSLQYRNLSWDLFLRDYPRM